MQKRFVLTFIFLVALAIILAGCANNSDAVTGQFFHKKIISIKPSAELTPNAANQITNFCYGREVTLNTGEPYGVTGKVLDADLELIAIDANEGLFQRSSTTTSIDKGKNYRFSYGGQFDLEIYVKDLTETTDGQGSGKVILCGIACPGPQYNLQTGQNILVSGKTVTFVAVDEDEVLINVDGQAGTIDEGKSNTINGVKIYVDSAIETSNDQGIGVFTFCDVTGAGVSTFSSTKLPTAKSTPKLPTTTKLSTELKPGILCYCELKHLAVDTVDLEVLYSVNGWEPKTLDIGKNYREANCETKLLAIDISDGEALYEVKAAYASGGGQIRSLDLNKNYRFNVCSA